jgi:hypothetical protein
MRNSSPDDKEIKKFGPGTAVIGHQSFIIYMVNLLFLNHLSGGTRKSAKKEVKTDRLEEGEI